jgi:uncharacterized protein (DUF3820 family)
MKTYHLNNPQGKLIELDLRTYRMPWGKHKGECLWGLPDGYLMSLENGFQHYKWGKLPDEQKFKVPLEIQGLARQVLKSRGYRKQGERWGH